MKYELSDEFKTCEEYKGYNNNSEDFIPTKEEFKNLIFESFSDMENNDKITVISARYIRYINCIVCSYTVSDNEDEILNRIIYLYQANEVLDELDGEITLDNIDKVSDNMKIKILRNEDYSQIDCIQTLVGFTRKKVAQMLDKRDEN